jgi:hypothetical protein
MVKLWHFDQVLKVEREVIYERRAKTNRQSPASTPRQPFPADADNPNYEKTRPRPEARQSDTTGLAFSGGGIRSAAICLGALQALHRHRLIEGIDYLSTVSGGGYVGCCLSAAMTKSGGGRFPFGEDLADTEAVAHLRNYSNYLMPRGRSAIRNLSDVLAIICRGVLANIVLVLTALLMFALITWTAQKFNLLHIFPGDPDKHPFRHTLVFLAGVGVVLIIWAVLRSFPKLDVHTEDSKSKVLYGIRIMIVVSLMIAVIELQPLAIKKEVLDRAPIIFLWLVFTIVISFLSGSLGRFLLASQQAKEWRTLALRGLTHFAIFLAAMALPIALWMTYLYLSSCTIRHERHFWTCVQLGPEPHLWAFCVLFVIALLLRPNNYSLYRFYRDRLSQAFLFNSQLRRDDPHYYLDNLKLSKEALINRPKVAHWRY